MKRQTQAQAILDFYKTMTHGFRLPKGIQVMNPFSDPAAWAATTAFYEKFYEDDRPRVYIFGINPGRFGGGVTGVPFTDPIRLDIECGIPNDWRKLPELSSQFIYEMIRVYGGVEKFYGDFFITAMSPLGYTREGRNLNYYDDKELLKDCEPYMTACIQQELATIPTVPTCFCLGEGENHKQFVKLNAKHDFFREIIPLPHPRWIMQYRRPRLREYAELYVEKLRSVALTSG